MASIRNTFDPSKFTKSITKQISGIQTGFQEIPSHSENWIQTGNYALNKHISGQFQKGVPLSKISVFAGEQGSGKSYLVSGSIIKNAQKNGIFVVLIDTESALDKDWLEAIGVDTSPEKIMRISATMIDDVAKIISDFVKSYKESYGELDIAEMPKVLISVDSLSMLLTHTDINQIEAGTLKGNMGLTQKNLKAMMSATSGMIGNVPIGLIATSHTYKQQDIFSPDDVVSGGSGPIYASSIVIAMQKRKLKLDEDGNKVSDVRGIRVACQINKSRFAKPFEKFEFTIPWNTGLDPYSGLVEFFEKHGIIQKVGNKLQYTSKDGTEYKEFRKNFGPDILDIIMAEYDDDAVAVTLDSETETDSEDYDPETGEIIE